MIAALSALATWPSRKATVTASPGASSTTADSAGFLRGILACESGEMFMRYFKEYMEQVFEGELGKRDLGLPREYLLNHTVCDFAETVRWWIKHAQYSPEEISEFFFKTAPLA